MLLWLLSVGKCVKEILLLLTNIDQRILFEPAHLLLHLSKVSQFLPFCGKEIERMAWFGNISKICSILPKKAHKIQTPSSSKTPQSWNILICVDVQGRKDWKIFVGHCWRRKAVTHIQNAAGREWKEPLEFCAFFKGITMNLK